MRRLEVCKAIFKVASAFPLLLSLAGCQIGSGTHRADPSLPAANEFVESGEAPPKAEAQEPSSDAKPVKVGEDASPAGGIKASPQGKSTRYVVSSSLWVRKGPGSKFAAVRALKRGDVVEVQETQRIWAKIGPEEFVSEKYLTATPLVNSLK